MQNARMKRWLAIAAIGATGLVACENDPVSLPEATNIVVSPASMTLYEGELSGASAQVLDQDGRVLRNADADWSSSAPAVATAENGVIRAVAPGTATIQATYGAHTATVDVTVEADTDEAASLEVMTDAVELHIQSQPQSVSFRTTDARGRAATCPGQDADVEVSDESVVQAYISACNAVTVNPQFNGTATVTVTVDGASDSFDVTVVSEQFGAFWAEQPEAGEFVAGNTVEYSVRVLNQENEGVEGETVQFSTTRGSLASTSVVTDEDGYATVSWTLPNTLRYQPAEMSGWQIDANPAWDEAAIAYAVELPSGVQQGSDYRPIDPAAATDIVMYWMYNNIADGLKEITGESVAVETGMGILLHARAYDEHGNVVSYDDRTYEFEPQDPTMFDSFEYPTYAYMYSNSEQTVTVTAYATGDDGLDPETDLSAAVDFIFEDPAN